MITDMPAKSADLGLTIEARDATHAAEIRACLEAAGFQAPVIRRIYLENFSDRMIDDTVRATPVALPMRSSTASMRAVVSASTIAIMS